MPKFRVEWRELQAGEVEAKDLKDAERQAKAALKSPQSLLVRIEPIDSIVTDVPEKTG